MDIDMSYSNTNDNSGCSVVLLPGCGLFGGVLILGCIAELTAEVTGFESTSVLNWEFGLAGTLLLTWVFLRSPFLRSSLLVTGTAIGMIVLLLALNGGDKEALDAWWLKAVVAVVSVGTGAIYLSWHLKRQGPG